MIRRVVLIRWKEGTTAADIDAVNKLGHPARGDRRVRSYTHGPDVGLGHEPADYTIVADFDDAEGWSVYDTHPVHDKVRAEIIRPHAAQISAATFTL